MSGGGEFQEHQGVRPRGKSARKRPTGGLQARLRALNTSASARSAEFAEPRRDCAHALMDEGEVHCTCPALTSARGVAAMACYGTRCGHAVLPQPTEEE